MELALEGGFITLFVGTFLVVLFTDRVPKELKNRAAAYAIIAAMGFGLLVSGSMRESALLMAGGLALVAVGLCAQLVPIRARQV